VITVVGEALVDLVVTPDGAITATAGGAPYNVARACARLRAPVSLVAAVSTDHFGQRLMTDLAADDVNTEHVQRTELPSTLAVRSTWRSPSSNADRTAVVSPAV
jgi:fructokinase